MATQNIKPIQLLCFMLLVSAIISCAEDAATTAEQSPVIIEVEGEYVQYLEHLDTYDLNEVTATLSLLRLQVPEAEQLAAQAISGVSVYKLVYQTTYQNEPVSASALIAIPQSDTPLPVLSFQNGTNTALTDAPTENHNDLFIKIISATAALGYISVVADYLGFGESAQLFHPYLCKDVTVSTIANLILATEELSTTATLEFELNGDLFLLGYSQGGHATMAVHQYLEKQTAFPLSLVATAAGAGPYNLTEVNGYVLTQSQYEQPHYAPYTLLSFQSMGFITEDLSTFFAAPYAEIIPRLFDGVHSQEEINASLTTDVASFYTPQLLQNFDTSPDFEALRTSFEANSISLAATQIPVRLYHGSADKYLQTSSSQNLRTALIDAGSSKEVVQYIEIADKNHEEAAPFALVDSLQWFGELR